MGTEKAEELIRKYLEGTATPEEEALLESWYNAAVQSQPEMPGEPDYPGIGQEILGSLRAEQDDQPKLDQRRGKPVIRLWPRVAAVAAVVLLVSALGLVYFHKGVPDVHSTIQQEGLIAGAVLTLSDGHRVALENVPVGGTIADGDLRIEKLDSATVGYDHHAVPEKGRNEKSGNNILSTEKGQQFCVVLPDGSRVWLNSDATLTYPCAFTGPDRSVQLSGEAYFEIRRDPAAPFMVRAPGMDVQVLGTRFDIMAYPDESTVRATLVDGSVAVSRGDKKRVLQAGEQALGSKTGLDSFSVFKADTVEVLAWRHGEFRFKKASIQPIMRQLARWYDVTIDYSGPISTASFTGVMTRKETSAQLLEALEISGDVHFTVRGKNITVKSGPP
jgi:ferric-dicitrate binding protein FerR (iron transport regulator)